MIKKENIEPGVILVVNDKRNVISPSKQGLNLYKGFSIGDDFKVVFGTKLKCVSKLKSNKNFSGKVVDVEYNGEIYSTYWMELRIQTNYHPAWLRKQKLEQINKDKNNEI